MANNSWPWSWSPLFVCVCERSLSCRTNLRFSRTASVRIAFSLISFQCREWHIWNATSIDFYRFPMLSAQSLRLNEKLDVICHYAQAPIWIRVRVFLYAWFANFPFSKSSWQSWMRCWVLRWCLRFEWLCWIRSIYSPALSWSLCQRKYQINKKLILDGNLECWRYIAVRYIHAARLRRWRK